MANKPDHGLYQIASGKGFLNTAFAGLVDWNTNEVKGIRTEMKRAKKQMRKAYMKKVVAQRLEDFHKEVGKDAKIT